MTKNPTFLEHHPHLPLDIVDRWVKRTMWSHVSAFFTPWNLLIFSSKQPKQHFTFFQNTLKERGKNNSTQSKLNWTCAPGPHTMLTSSKIQLTIVFQNEKMISKNYFWKLFLIIIFTKIIVNNYFKNYFLKLFLKIISENYFQNYFQNYFSNYF